MTKLESINNSECYNDQARAPNQTSDVLSREMIEWFRDSALQLPDLGIVISGMSGRFPKADSVNEFEANLRQGLDMILDEDDLRWPCGKWDLPRRYGRLKSLEKFDNDFFGITRDQANKLDPQSRVLYEVVYESIIDAGLNPSQLKGTKTACFRGNSFTPLTLYTEQILKYDLKHEDDPSSKICKYFGFIGPSASFDSACSSSLTALKAGIQAISDGDADRAIIFSTNVPLNPNYSGGFVDLGSLSPDGKIKFMDLNADGYVRAEAVVSILIERKETSKRFYSSLMACENSIDGYKIEGFTYPSGKAHADLHRFVKNMCRVSTNHVQYIECHGTGTQAGDLEEIGGLMSVYTDDENRFVGPLVLGSVKSNMGHGEAASGLCSLVKVNLMFEYELIYKSLNLTTIRPDFDEAIKSNLIKHSSELMRLEGKVIGVANYGLGGTNSSVIVKARVNLDPGDNQVIERPQHIRLVVMFGRGKSQLDFFFDSIMDGQNYATRNCLSDNFLSLVDSINSQKIDRLMTHRGYIVVNTQERLQLSKEIREYNASPSINGHLQDTSGGPQVNIIFPGFGSDWPQMASGLQNYEPFWSTIERLDEHLKAANITNIDLREILTSEKELTHTVSRWVAITAYSIALINIVRDQLKLEGIKYYVGHSLGEIACAYARGLINERQTILLSYNIVASLYDDLESVSGKTYVTMLNNSQVEQIIQDLNLTTVRVCCVNGPSSTAVSGSKDEMELFRLHFEHNRIWYKVIFEDIVAHNFPNTREELFDRMKSSNAQIMRDVCHDDRVTSIGCWQENWLPLVEGWELEKIKLMSLADYLTDSMRTKINLTKALCQLEDNSIIIELGPSGQFGSQIDKSKKHDYVTLMKRSIPSNMQVTHLLSSIGRLHCIGAKIDIYNFNKLSTQNNKGNLASKQDYADQQIPSLSSLIRWNHDHDLFVMNYSETKSIKIVELMTFRELHPYLDDHKLDGRVIIPACGFIYLAWRYFSLTDMQNSERELAEVDGNDDEFKPVEFENVRFHRVVIIRPDSKLEVKYQRDMGRFEIIESGEIVCDGYMSSPKVKPKGLLYENPCPKSASSHSESSSAIDEDNSSTLNHEDIYTQFRIWGLDFGRTFKQVRSSSTNGDVKWVNYNEHLICFLDSLLQSFIIGSDEYYGSMNLHLPVGIDYLRIQPDSIVEKLRNHNLKIEKPTHQIIQQLTNDEQQVVVDEPQECLFEVYGGSRYNLLVTNGVEMRGLQAQRTPNKFIEADIKSQQFVRDMDTATIDLEYSQLCDSISRNWLTGRGYLDGEVTRNPCQDVNKSITNNKIDDSKLILSILEQFDGLNLIEIGELIDTNAVGLATQTLSERFRSQESLLMPLMEIVVENVCKESKKFSMLEVNRDYNCLINQVRKIVTKIDKQLKIEPSILNPNIEFMECNGLIERLEDYDMKSSFMDLKSLDNIKNYHTSFNCIFYRDMGCNLIWSLQNEDLMESESQLEEEIKSITKVLDINGYMFVLAKTKFTLCELIIYSLSQAYQEHKIYSNSTLETLKERFKTILIPKLCMLDSSTSIQSNRCNKIESVANQETLACVAKKQDSHNGNVLYLFKKLAQHESISMKQIQTKPSVLTEGRSILKINYHSHPIWLDQLRTNFQANKQSTSGSKQVWLCAVASKQSQNGGVIGMMKTLIKELGSTNFRCYYDMHSFRDKDDAKISLNDIKRCKKFQLALLRDQLWNCVDCWGNFGSFRHMDVGDSSTAQLELCNVKNQKEDDYVTVKSDEEYQFAHVAQCQPGILSSFTWFESNYKVDSDFKQAVAKQGLSFVRIHYSALNFKDIMLASGLLPGERSPKTLQDSKMISNTNLGLEFSGVNLMTGKRVMGSCPSGSIATGIVSSKYLGLEIECPDWLSLEQAATIPAVYMTTIYGLVMRAKIKRGESVLIHAASGGVGQAALNICNHFGLTIYATVGTVQKKQFLLDEYGHCVEESRIFSSRDCNFEHQIMSMTRGRGVDVLLNSLYGRHLQASLRCLAAGGRFVEIGKRDLFENSKLDLPELNDNKTIISVDAVALIYISDISIVRLKNRAVREILIGLEQGYVKPIKHKLFKINEIEDAFRFMSKAKHIGKIIIEINKFERNEGDKRFYPKLNIAPTPKFSSSKCYIVTGGLGGFGFELCRWLIMSQGVRNLIITTRTDAKKSSHIKATIDLVNKTHGCNVVVLTKSDVDTTTREGCMKLCQQALNMSPDRQIGGIFHLAMLLKDSPIETLTPEEFDEVYQPKVYTGSYLDEITRELGLKMDYFVCFSSMASAFGNSGQTSYSYANSELERLCEARRRDGLHGLAIQWGPIGDVGFFYNLVKDNLTELEGLLPQRMSSCMNTLAKLLTCNSAVYSSCIRASESMEHLEFGQKTNIGLYETILDVLGFKDNLSLDENANLIALGADSIMMVEIKRHLEQRTSKVYTVQELRALTVGDIKRISQMYNKENKNNSNEFNEPGEINVLIDHQKSITKDIAMEDVILGLSNKKMVGLRMRELATKSNIRLMVPKLNMPKDKFMRLNDVASSHGVSQLDLLFFFGPVYNDLSILQPICQSITNRLCVGLNYTPEHSSDDNWTIERSVDLFVNYLYEFYETKVFVDHHSSKLNGENGSSRSELTEVDIDISGFSYGGIIAFEVVARLNELYSQTKQSSLQDHQNSDDYKKSFILKPNKLIMLDMSPKIRGHILALTIDDVFSGDMKKQTIRSALLFVVTHVHRNDINVKESQFNIFKFYPKLVMCADVNDAIRFASETLATYLDKYMTPAYYESEFGVEQSEFANAKPTRDQLSNIANESLTSYLHRLSLVLDYKCFKRTNVDCLLLRTKGFLYSINTQLADDLNLSEFIDGNIEVTCLSGDHLTFLMNNVKTIAQRIREFLD